MIKPLITTIGTTPKTLVGEDVNLYVISSRKLSRLGDYLDSSQILSSKIAVQNLPEDAIVIKDISWRGWTGAPAKDYPDVPLFLRVFFTGVEVETIWGGWAAHKQGYYFTLNSPRGPKYAGCLGRPNGEVGPESIGILQPSIAPVNFSNNFMTLEDMQIVGISFQYLLKLFQIAYNIHYDEATIRWLGE